MFYENPEHVDSALRFGDVLKGFAVCTPKINNPPLPDELNCQIEISKPPFYVILSPCCSIRDKILSLAPLVPIKNSLFGNPYFAEDPTRINIKIEPIYSLPSLAWESMDPREKAERLGKGLSYSLLEYFVYREHDLFPQYKIPRQQGDILSRHYMIDFRAAFRVACDRIQSPEQSPLECKCLQLNNETRGLLRDKILFYFSRITAEEIALTV